MLLTSSSDTEKTEVVVLHSRALLTNNFQKISFPHFNIPYIFDLSQNAFMNYWHRILHKLRTFMYVSKDVVGWLDPGLNFSQ